MQEKISQFKTVYQKVDTSKENFEMVAQTSISYIDLYANALSGAYE